MFVHLVNEQNILFFIQHILTYTTTSIICLATDINVILYIATSLIGYIAKPNDDLTFLSIVEQKG